MEFSSSHKGSGATFFCPRQVASLVMFTILLGAQAAVAELSFYERMRAFRENLTHDPYRPGYHIVNSEDTVDPFDVNGAIFWKGRYHLFYIFQDSRGHNWGHVSSFDLVHWRHHPTGLVSGMFSGNCFVNKEGVPTMCYHGQLRGGNTMAIALDDQLNTWRKLNLITPKTVEGNKFHGKYHSWDPCGWLEGDTYYAIFGGKDGNKAGVVKSKALEGPWEYVGDLMAHSIGDIEINEDVSCPDFFKIGDKYMLLCLNHKRGCRYYLGQWKNEQFYPEFHERMSWVDGEFYAPKSLLDGKGRRIMWAWIRDRRHDDNRGEYGWNGTLSLPRVLSLGDDGMLRIEPPEELNILRSNPKKMADLTVKADSQVPLKDILGNSIEISVEMSPAGAEQFGVKVCASPDGQEQTLIYYDAEDNKLKIDTNQSSLTEGPKKIEGGPLELKPGEPLKLRVYVDKSVIEVFANSRQAVTRRIYPSRKDSVNVAVFSKGGFVKVCNIRAWKMMPSNPY